MIYITPSQRNNNPRFSFPRLESSTKSKGWKLQSFRGFFILPFISTETINHHLSTGHMRTDNCSLARRCRRHGKRDRKWASGEETQSSIGQATTDTICMYTLIRRTWDRWLQTEGPLMSAKWHHIQRLAGQTIHGFVKCRLRASDNFSYIFFK